MSSYNKQPESVLSRSNPTWYVFSITIFYIKCMDLKTWSTCISIPVFARVNHRSCISFIFTSPLQTRTLWNTMGPACMAPWRFLKPAQQSRCYQCHNQRCSKPAVGDWFCSPFGALINKPVYCNQMDLEHCWYESSTWTDVWHTEWWTMVRFLTGCLAQCFRYSFGALAPC